jgi:dCMP deaminase
MKTKQRDTLLKQATLKPKFLEYYMRMAELTSTLSSAVRLQVGSVIVKDDQVLATGYNGTPSGWDNDCENKEWCRSGGWLSPEEIEEGWPYEGEYTDADGNVMQGRYRLVTKNIVLHSEMNALMRVARSTESSEGASLFCTHAPCLNCAKAIYQAGISSVYYRNSYRDDSGINFLEKSGVTITQHSN